MAVAYLVLHAFDAAHEHTRVQPRVGVIGPAAIEVVAVVFHVSESQSAPGCHHRQRVQLLVRLRLLWSDMAII